MGHHDLTNLSSMHKSALRYGHYRWSDYEAEDPKICGMPDQTPFNRDEGREVLYLINALAQRWTLRQLESFHKIEWMLHEKLPIRLKRQCAVAEWIRKNWDKY